MDTKEMAKQVRLSQWAEIMRERKESGLNVRTWCEGKGISEKTYYYWQGKLRKAACEGFVEARAASETSLAPLQFAEVKLKEAPMCPALPKAPSQLHVEIGGAQITISDEYPPDKLAALLRELMRSC